MSNFFPDFPPGFDDQTTMFLALGNRVCISHPNAWPRYWNEAVKQWVGIPTVYEEGDKL